MAFTKEQMLEAIARAKLLVAAAKEKAALKEAALESSRLTSLGAVIASTLPASPKIKGDLEWNAEQQLAIDHGFFGKSFCLIGAAGTGKTTTLKAILSTLMENNRIPPLNSATKHLLQGAPGVALISYTRRAVRNIAKQLSADLKSHCITFHKLVEYEPFYYEEWDDLTNSMCKKMRFQPARSRMNPLPTNLRLIIIDESSMLSIDYFNEVLDALPHPSQVQFIFLGDLNQLPPVYGQAILGKMLLQLPIVELTRVYRQALESPIISLALAVKDNNFSSFSADCRSGQFQLTQFDRTTNQIALTPQLPLDPMNIAQKTIIYREGRGKVTLHPWKKTIEKDDALHLMQNFLGSMIKSGEYDPIEDLVLCPWNTSFGTDELNKSIANFISKTNSLLVHEVIAGYNRLYLAVGDKLLVDKQEAIILDIRPNGRYLGKRPQPASIHLNRWGNLLRASENAAPVLGLFGEDLTDEEIDFLLEHAADVTDRTAESSHSIRVLYQDSGEEEVLTKSASLNTSSFGYAITVHKAQGSECRRVFLLLHECHAAMCSRELIYTAITRAAEELYIVLPPKMLARAASKPRIKGDTLAAKLEFFNSRMQEKE